LKVQRHVIAGCVYGKNGRPLATWKRDPGSAEAWPFIAQPQSMLMTTRDLSVFREVHLGGETIGTVYIRSDLGEIQERVRRYALIGLVVLVMASLVALLLASTLQGLISRPLLALASTARRVSEEQDYSVRAPR